MSDLRLKKAAEALLLAVQQIVDAAGATQLRYYDQKTSPLGRRKHLDLAREGVLRGFKPPGSRLVLIPRDEVHEYIERHPVRPDIAPPPPSDDLEAVLGELEGRGRR